MYENKSVTISVNTDFISSPAASCQLRPQHRGLQLRQRHGHASRVCTDSRAVFAATANTDAQTRPGNQTSTSQFSGCYLLTSIEPGFRRFSLMEEWNLASFRCSIHMWPTCGFFSGPRLTLTSVADSGRCVSDSVCSATTEAQVADVRPAGICNWAQEGDSSSQGHTSKPERLALKSLIIFSISIKNLFYFERILEPSRPGVGRRCCKVSDIENNLMMDSLNMPSISKDSIHPSFSRWLPWCINTAPNSRQWLHV